MKTIKSALNESRFISNKSAFLISVLFFFFIVIFDVTFVSVYANYEGCKIIDLSTKYYFCTGKNNDVPKDIHITTTGNVKKLWNEYQYDVDLVLNVNDLPETTFVVVANTQFQTLKLECYNYTRLEMYPEKEFIYAVFNRTQIKCHLSGYVISNSYQKAQDIGIKKIKIIPYVISSVKKSFFNDTQLQDPHLTSLGRRVVGHMKNPTKYTIHVNFKLFRTIQNNQNAMNLDNMKLMSKGEYELYPNSTISIYVVDEYNDSYVYWFNPEPYFKTKYIVNDHVKFVDITPKPKPISEGGTIAPPIEEEKEKPLCYAIFRKDIIYHDYENREVKVLLSFLNPCNETKELSIVDPIGDEFAVLELPFGRLLNKKIYFNFTISANSKRSFNYTLKYIGKENLVFLPGLIVYDNNKTFTTDPLPLVFGPIKENVIYVMKRLRFIGENVKVDINVKNYGKAVEFFLKDLAEFYSALTQQFYKKGIWKVSLMENEQWDVSYITIANEKMYLLPQIIGFHGKIFYSVIYTAKLKEKINVKTPNIEYFGIFIVISITLVSLYGLILTILSRFKESFEWYSIKSRINKFKKLLK